MPYLPAGFGALGSHAVDRVYRTTLPANPEAASMVSLDAIHALAREGREDPMVRRTAFLILRQAGVPERHAPAAIVAIHRWIQQHLYYMHDPAGVEMLTQARVLLQQVERGEAVEDCDSFVLLEHALLNAVGVPTRSVIWKADRRAPDQWSHITLEAHDGRGWVSLDPIMKDKPVGWAPPQYYAKRVVPIGDGPPFPAGLTGRFEVAYLPRDQARETIAGWFSGASNMVGWRGFAEYGADAVAAPVAPDPGLMVQRRLEGEIRELRRMRTEALAYMLPLFEAVEPLMATMERAGVRVSDRMATLAKVNKVVEYVGYALSALSYVTAGITEVINIALQLGNAAYQARQGAALISGSASKTLAEVASALEGVGGGLAAAAYTVKMVEVAEQQRERILGTRPRILRELEQERTAELVVAMTAPSAGLPLVPLVAAAAGIFLAVAVW